MLINARFFLREGPSLVVIATSLSHVLHFSVFLSPARSKSHSAPLPLQSYVYLSSYLLPMFYSSRRLVACTWVYISRLHAGRLPSSAMRPPHCVYVRGRIYDDTKWRAPSSAAAALS